MDFTCIYGSSDRGLFQINLTTQFCHIYCTCRLLYLWKKKASRVLSLGLHICPPVFRVLVSGRDSPSVSCSHSFSSPGSDHICLLIAWASIPAVKFNTSLKPSAKPESFREEQAIKGTLARSSCWLIYWLANCGRVFVCLISVLFSGGVFGSDVSPRCPIWKQNYIQSSWVGAI